VSNNRILIVEDEAIVALGIRTALEDMNYEVVSVVDTGEEALEQIEAKKPDLVLMDIQLASVMDGVETARKIRQRFGIPLIYLTANSNDTTFQQAKTSAPSAFISKPYKKAELSKAIDLALDQYRRTEATRQLLATVVEFSHDAIISLDLNGDVATWNQGAENIYGIEAEAAIGRPLIQFFAATDKIASLLERVYAGKGVQHYETQRQHSSGQQRHISTTLSPMLDEQGQVIGISSIDRDISARAKAEQALRRAREELEVRVRERTAELRAANEELEREITERKAMEKEMVRLERLRALGELATGISHNLNNLLVGIVGPAEALQQCSDPVQIREWAQLIMETGQRAAALVKRLNTAVRSQPEAIEAVDVEETLREAIQSVRLRWQNAQTKRATPLGIALDIQTVPHVSGTSIGLHDALVNLLLNAADAQPNGGRINISVYHIEHRVQIEVRDDGRGMDSETLRRVFEPFFTTKADVGSGLGLTMTERKISSWGGRIDVERCFTLHLPIWESVPVPNNLPHLHLFIAENNGPVTQVLHQWLAADHDVDLVTSGPQALERFDPERHEIALIDWELPGLAADQLAGRLRELRPDLVAIVMSSWQLEENAPYFEAFDLALQKPFNLQAVDQVLRRAIKLRKRNAAL